MTNLVSKDDYKENLLKPAKCRKCHAKIYWLKTAKDKNIPVDFHSVTLQEINAIIGKMNVVFNPEHHITHFETCPYADDFRTKDQAKNQ